MEHVLVLVTRLHVILPVIIVKMLMVTVSVEQTVISMVTAAAMSTALHVNEAIMLTVTYNKLIINHHACTIIIIS